MHGRTRLTFGALGAALALLGGGPANASHTVIQAENGLIDNTGCGDDGPMAYQGTVVFHPGSGCSQTFHTLASFMGPMDQIRFYMTGSSGTMCGYFEVSGGFTGKTNTVCNSGGWTTATFSTGMRWGNNYKITWKTATGTPTWVNAYVDYHTAH